MEKYNKDRTLVKMEWLRKAEVEEVLIKKVDLLKKVRELKAKDDKVIKAVEEMKQAGVKMLRDEEWREEDGLILKEEKVYVPKDKELRAEIIWLYHNTPIGGTWRAREDGGAGHMKLLVARSDQEDEEICGEMRLLLMEQKLNNSTGRKTHAKQSAGETMDTYHSRLYHQAAISPRI